MNTLANAIRRMSAAVRPFRAALLAVLVVAVAVAAWLVGASNSTPQPPAAASPSAPSIQPSGAAIWPSPSTSVTSSEPGEEPTNPASPPAAGPDAVEAAINAAAHWLNAYPPMTAERWLYELRPLVTRQVADSLEGVDPSGTVPAGKVGTGTRGTMLADNLAEVTVPVVTGSRTSPAPLGTLKLEMLRGGGRWLVSRIDWTPS